MLSIVPFRAAVSRPAFRSSICHDVLQGDGYGTRRRPGGSAAARPICPGFWWNKRHLIPVTLFSPARNGEAAVRKTQGVAIALPAAVAVVAAMAIGIEIWTRRTEARHPAKGRVIHVDGVALQHVERGSGPAILLLHGNGAMVEDMILSGLMARLGRTHRVIAIDRPGFGHSSRPRDRKWTAAAQAELLWAALDHLGVERAIIAGQSWGALAAMAMGLARPERTEGLVLASGYYYPLQRFKVRLCAMSALPLIGPLMRHTVAPILSALVSPMMVKKIFAPAPVPEHFREFPIE